MVCLGEDGHAGLGLATETGSCPCELESPTEDALAELAKNQTRHSPCEDITLDFDVFGDAALAPRLSMPAAPRPDDHPVVVADWVSDGRSSRQATGTSPSWVTARPAWPQQQLELRRTIVLLI